MEYKNKFIEPIAIIGMACRLPNNINSPDELWSYILKGESELSYLPKSRFGFPLDETDENQEEKTIGKVQHVNAIDQFDAKFFNISDAEAMCMDPQQRLLLEVSWEALEDAGISPAALIDSDTGVFVGLDDSGYQYNKCRDNGFEDLSIYDGTGNGHSFSVGRLSYFYSFTGPNMAIDTSCSSSLVATHIACNSIRMNECKIALVGGVELILSIEKALFLKKSGALSPDGKCKVFDNKADGYGRGEGCCFLVLKNLEEALKDNDRIYAMICGNSVNHDGKSSALTVPNGLMQESLIRQTLHRFNIDAGEIGYIEAHGTGTKIGDIIEVEALHNVFNLNRKDIFLGSVKANIGHLHAVAGIAGVIKAVLCIKNKYIPKQINFETLNLNIARFLERVPVSTSHIPWQGNKLRIVSISSFGLSGTNAHVLIKDFIDPKKNIIKNNTQTEFLFTLSARKEALNSLTKKYISFLNDTEKKHISLRDICYTSNKGRMAFENRFYFVTKSKNDLSFELLKLQNSLKNESDVDDLPYKGNNTSIAFCFEGLGWQFPGMGKSILKENPFCMRYYGICEEVIKKKFGISLDDYILNNKEEFDFDVRYSMTGVFVIEYCLFKVLAHWGIIPEIVFGNDIGELAAACSAGIFELEDGIQFLTELVELLISLFPDTEILNAVKHGNFIWEFGGQETLTMISKIFCETVRLKPPQIPLYPGLKKPFSNELFSQPEYWLNLLKGTREPSTIIERLTEEEITIVVQIGSKKKMNNYTFLVENKSPVWIETLDRNKNTHLLHTLGKLYKSGCNIDWINYYKNKNCNIVNIPLYPFQRKRYWFSSNKTRIIPEIEKNNKSSNGGNVIKHLNTLQTNDEKLNYIKTALKNMISFILGMDDGAIICSNALHELNFDSFSAIQLQSSFQNSFNLEFPIQDFIDGISLDGVATMILEKISLEN